MQAQYSLPSLTAPAHSLEPTLALCLLRVVEAAALAAARTMGQGDAHAADQAAVEAMRDALARAPLDGRIVIGEGERDQAPMLFIGERVGARAAARPAAAQLGLVAQDNPHLAAPVETPSVAAQPAAAGPLPPMSDTAAGLHTVDIAVDPLEGTNLCATGAPGAIAVMAASETGGLLHAPDCYMEKIIVGPECRGAVDLDAPVERNLRVIARRLDREIEDLVVVVLDRPRHQNLIAQIRATGARIRLITDGDLSAGIATALQGTAVHVVMGTGGAPEGVLTAAALRCLNGEILARLAPANQAQRERIARMGIPDSRRIFRTDDLAPGHQLVFAACGVTGGSLLRGVRFFRDGARTHALVMSSAQGLVRFTDSVHLDRRPLSRIRFG